MLLLLWVGQPGGEMGQLPLSLDFLLGREAIILSLALQEELRLCPAPCLEAVQKPDETSEDFQIQVSLPLLLSFFHTLYFSYPCEWFKKKKEK